MTMLSCEEIEGLKNRELLALLEEAIERGAGCDSYPRTAFRIEILRRLDESYY